MSDENKGFVLTQKAYDMAGVPDDIDSFDVWVENMSDEELKNLSYLVEEARLDDDVAGLLTVYSLIFFCREMDIDTLPEDHKLIADLLTAFCTNVVIASMRREGLVETDGPITMYKDFKLKATEKGRAKYEDLR